jgi:hypothetical protein
MRINFTHAAVVTLVACATACGSPADVPQDDTDAAATEASSTIVLCERDDGSYGVLLAYAAIDADGDGVTVPASGQLCTGGALPPPYLAVESGLDCDDTDPAVDRLAVLYPDQDGDGVGATPRQTLCIGATTPQGFAPGGYDDDDADPTVIESEEGDLVLGL